MTIQKYLTKQIIIYLIFTTIFIKATLKLKVIDKEADSKINSVSNIKKINANSHKFIRITKPTRPEAPKLPEEICIGSKKKPDRKDIILSKPPTDKFGNSGDNGGITTINNNNIDNTVIKNDKSISSESGDTEIQKMKVNWFDTNLEAKDVGVNSQGDVYVVGADDKLYEYEFLTNTFVHVEGDFELSKINRVDVSWEGVPYVITETGDTFYLSCDHKWMRLKGCATDIGTGRGGEVYKTGCDKRENGFGIYKLFCNTPVTCDYRGCLNFRKKKNFAWTHKGSERNCEWFRIDGNGIKIDVAPNGNPYVIDKNGEIKFFDGIKWRKFSNEIKAYDLTISNEGVLYYIGQDANIYKSQKESEGKWIQLEGQGIAISVGPFAHPWIISNPDNHLKGSAKSNYN